MARIGVVPENGRTTSTVTRMIYNAIRFVSFTNGPDLL